MHCFIETFVRPYTVTIKLKSKNDPLFLVLQLEESDTIAEMVFQL